MANKQNLMYVLISLNTFINTHIRNSEKILNINISNKNAYIENNKIKNIVERNSLKIIYYANFTL